MKVAILWLINEKGQILLCKRALNERSDAGVWGPSVSGKIEAGETPLQAIVRETNEELGLADTQIYPTFLFEESFMHKDGIIREFSLFYSTTKTEIINSLKFKTDEVAEAKWFNLSEIEQLANNQSEKLIISEATNLWTNIIHHLKTLQVDLKSSYK